MALARTILLGSVIASLSMTVLHDARSAPSHVDATIDQIAVDGQNGLPEAPPMVLFKCSEWPRGRICSTEMMRERLKEIDAPEACSHRAEC